MKRKPAAKPRSYFEPWRATKSVMHGVCPNVDDIPDVAASYCSDAWYRADRDADWILWGSRMSEPGVALDYLSGQTHTTNDERIIAVRRCLGLADGSPTNEEVCKRIAECVNALAGIADPVSFVSDARSLLFSCVRGECDDPRDDVRMISLLGRCVPLDQAKDNGYGQE